MHGKLRIKQLIEGEGEGDLLVYPKPISFLGEIDAKRGVLLPAEKADVKDKILVFPYMRGSTVGSYVIYALRYYKKAPTAMIVEKTDPILVAGCALAQIPLAVAVDKIDWNRLASYSKGKLSGSLLLLY